MDDKVIVSQEVLNVLSNLNIDSKNLKPQISSKRPFGNSDYYNDVLRLTGSLEEYTNEYGTISDEGKQYVESMLEDVNLALEILVQQGEIEIAEYEKNDGKWEKIESVSGK